MATAISGSGKLTSTVSKPKVFRCLSACSKHCASLWPSRSASFQAFKGTPKRFILPFGGGKLREVASNSSTPLMLEYTSSASVTELASGPMTSYELASATSPKRETLPYVGLKPTTPQKGAG